MLDNCRQVFVVLIWVHACTDQVFGIRSIVFDSAFRLSFMMHWSSAMSDLGPRTVDVRSWMLEVDIDVGSGM